MFETPFVLLSQDDCPRCERLKVLLESPLRGRYRDDITVVHRQSHPELFQTIAEAYGVKSTPVLIRQTGGEVLTDVSSISSVNMFLRAPLQ